jgi:Domain of unknown function (DUF3368)
VIDDREARAAARALGVRLIGTLGVVILARWEGRIPAAASVIADLRRAGLHLDDELLQQALRQFVGKIGDSEVSPQATLPTCQRLQPCRGPAARRAGELPERPRQPVARRAGRERQNSDTTVALFEGDEAELAKKGWLQDGGRLRTCTGRQRNT